MSVALPAGWIDTGVRRSITVSAKVRLWMTCYADPDPTPHLNGWRVTCWGIYGWDQEESGYRIVITNEWETEQYEVGRWMKETRPLIDPQWSPDYALTDTRGPYRLGARYTNPGGYPAYSIDSTMEFAWFADRNTRLDTSCAGITLPTHYYRPGSEFGWEEEQAPGEFEPVNVGRWIGELAFGGGPGDEDGRLWTIFSALTCDGSVVPTEELNIEGDFVGQGNGVVHQYGQPAGPFHQWRYAWASPPIRARYDVQITQAGRQAPNWARFVDAPQDPRICDGQPDSPQFVTAPAVNGVFEFIRCSWPMARRWRKVQDAGGVAVPPEHQGEWNWQSA